MKRLIAGLGYHIGWTILRICGTVIIMTNDRGTTVKIYPKREAVCFYGEND